MPSLQNKFQGCLLGATVGDVIGAVVESESPQYIAKTFSTVDDILLTQSVEELTGPDWQVGKFTDDTQMMLCIGEWLIAGEAPNPQPLLARFARAYEPWRHYGSGTAGILRIYPQHESNWRDLATAQFPHGSQGNGSAMRVAPVGLAFSRDLKAVASVAIESSRPTHSHPLAFQGAVLQALAVAIAINATTFDSGAFLKPLRASLTRFSDLLQDTVPFTTGLDEIERGLSRGASCAEMSEVLGTGATAREAVPMAIYCFLRHPNSYVDVIRGAVFLGGDTDTIAAMAGAISGAFLGRDAIPAHWIDAIREEHYTPSKVTALADRLHETHFNHG